MLMGPASVLLYSCKDKKKAEPEVTAPVPMEPVPAPQAAPVVISADDSLQKGVMDATKDFPGVTATVSNGEITLKGEIQKSQRVKLIQALNALRPKKINNELVVK